MNTARPRSPTDHTDHTDLYWKDVAGMLRIPCPWCGPRDEAEFRYGGQARVAYPEDPWALDDTAWGEYLFVRDNPEGWFVERWFHNAGCRRWCDVVRDTRTNLIADSGPTGAELSEVTR